MERRYDIDWLRVIAIGLLLIYHIAISFQSWGPMIGFITTKKTLEGLWIPMTMINIWRIPFLFVVSGMGVAFAMIRRTWRQLLVERSRRILIPFLFGFVAIVPIHVYLLQIHYHLPVSYQPSAGHLWFLGNIFTYVLILSPLFFYLKHHESGAISHGIQKVFATPIGFLLMAGFFALETWIMEPGIYELYAMNWHGYFLGLIGFAFGFLFIHSGSDFWQLLLRWKWALVGLALSLYAVRFIFFELKSPGHLMAIESATWILAIFSLGYTYLNRPSQTLRYLSEAAYPIYILHMVFLYLGGYLIFQLDISGVAQLLLLIPFTFAGCFLVYEGLVKRIGVLRFLFGLRGDRN